MPDHRNIEPKTVAGFGDQWQRLDQTGMPARESREIFDSYFTTFPWSKVSKDAVGFDLGCGSGRWARWVAPRVGQLHCIDPSVAIEVARANLGEFKNCVFHKAGVDDMPLAPGSMDFGYSLGVLHHVPDTRAALAKCVSKLKPGAPLLVYLYYAFDNKPAWYRVIWRVSALLRQIVSRMPSGLRYVTSQLVAALVYWPLARVARLAEAMGVDVSNFPLSAYRSRSFYGMRTDALDRFGTRLEHRFTKAQIEDMMKAAGLEDIRFGADVPYWCAVGFAKKN